MINKEIFLKQNIIYLQMGTDSYKEKKLYFLYQWVMIFLGCYSNKQIVDLEIFII